MNISKLIRLKFSVLKIWLWVDEALAMYEQGDIEKVNICGIEFLRLLKKLRVVPSRMRQS